MAKTAAAPERTARKRTGGRERGSGRERRRQAPRRVPLPDAKRELLISADVGEQRVALLEDDRVAEVYLERPERRSITGNIYLGTVDNVLPGMEAAFVEIGLEKNGFLYVDEIVVPELEGKRHGKKITDLIQRGQQLLVQAVKDPMKTKGARLTTEISLPGRFLVFVPNGEGLGVSRRLDDTERQRLKDILKDLVPAKGGVIVRTAAEGASAEDIERDLVFLQRLWKTIEARAKSASAPSLVYQEAELPLRIVRDLFAGDFVAAHVDSDRTYKRIVSYLKKTSPHMVERVHHTKDKEPLFERFGVEDEIASTLDRRVDLPSGGYLIFDYAEAFTVIDVNTGRFVGSRSKSSTQRLEDTATKNNLEAVKEVVRQLRLRDIGGIIVIDFIDMANPKNRQAVEDALRTELERDRTKTYVVEISPLGLVEMTRQNVTDGPREIMTRPCPTCGGDGIVVSDATNALQITRRLRALAVAGAGSRVQAYKVALHPRTLSLVAGPGGARLAALEDATRRRFYLVPAEGHVHADHFEVLAEGRRADLAPAAAVDEGTEVELKLVEVDLHDAGAAVGKVDGIDIVVADAAKLVGKKRKVLDRSRSRGAGVRVAGRRRSRRVADHLRERGREADPRADAPQGAGGGDRWAAVRRTGRRSGGRRASARRPSRSTGDRGRRGRRRGRRGAEAHAARLTRRTTAQEVADIRSGGDGRGPGAERSPTSSPSPSRKPPSNRPPRLAGAARRRFTSPVATRRRRSPPSSTATARSDRRRTPPLKSRTSRPSPPASRPTTASPRPRASGRVVALAVGGTAAVSPRRRTATALSRPRRTSRRRMRTTSMPNRPSRPRRPPLRNRRKRVRGTSRCPSGSRTSTIGDEPTAAQVGAGIFATIPPLAGAARDFLVR